MHKKIIILSCVLFISFVGCESKKQECKKGHLENIESCDQKGNSGWQNSGKSYVISRGVPKKEFCTTFIDNISSLDSVGSTCKNWKQNACEHVGMNDWQCFECDQLSENANTHYYYLAATSKDCKKGIFVSSSGITPKDLSDKI